MKTMRPESEAPVPTGWFGDLHDDIRSSPPPTVVD